MTIKKSTLRNIDGVERVDVTCANGQRFTVSSTADETLVFPAAGKLIEVWGTRPADRQAALAWIEAQPEAQRKGGGGRLSPRERRSIMRDLGMVQVRSNSGKVCFE